MSVKQNLFFICFIMDLVACQHRPLKGHDQQSSQQCLTEHRVPSMGTFFEFQLVHACDYDPNPVIIKSKTLLDSIESQLSLYQPESQLSQLNRSGEYCAPGEHLLTLIQTSKEYYTKTEGLFDVTILPVLRAIEESFAKTKKPPVELGQFRSFVNSDLIHVDTDCISLVRKGMAISLDGIAKGYAVDLVASKLPREITSYLLNFSGNMLWRGHKPEGSWSIGLWNPVLHAVTPLNVGEAGAIASSGSENASFDREQRWHHVINPRTLYPPYFHASVTILGPTAMACDVLSTTFINLKRLQARSLWKRKFSQYSLWFIDHSGNITHYP